jgi:hypothetical protein
MLVNACIVNVEVMCGDRWVQLVKVYVCRKKFGRLRATPRMNLALKVRGPCFFRGSVGVFVLCAKKWTRSKMHGPGPISQKMSKKNLDNFCEIGPGPNFPPPPCVVWNFVHPLFLEELVQNGRTHLVQVQKKVPDLNKRSPA